MRKRKPYFVTREGSM